MNTCGRMAISSKDQRLYQRRDTLKTWWTGQVRITMRLEQFYFFFTFLTFHFFRIFRFITSEGQINNERFFIKFVCHRLFVYAIPKLRYYLICLFDFIFSVFPVSTDVPFPKTFPSLCRKILTRLFRVFVHVYIHHFDRIVSIGAVSRISFLILINWYYYY